ncbi:hypothetical protein AWM75_05305 [Aerococcus urinaehominis]|uniref:ABC3 transporter permease C-terminal domain-containing protein n=1 Tax=Aerococcus urinaehominis TaxID=128944 RepID=A0A109RGQ2_9LACT|nr:FtsX-like permease family protein [Aerococcus urinaehominis]AMB99446.1 hypothetical protein AWM75_05305 [Aerococcus urinaehominis]SDM28713.1 putative ABC transport system permease protein [Aerococcus urinaehominis]
MTKKTLWKDNFREISRNLSRFIALMAIIILGTGFFVGIRAAAPDMKATADQYFSQQYLQDLDIQSTAGLYQADLDRLEEVEGVDWYPYASVDREIAGSQELVRFYPNFNEMGDINHFNVQEGRLPQADDEIALELGRTDHKIGDQITLTDLGLVDNDQAPHLTTDKFTVVGLVKSPLYIDETASRFTNIGNGRLNGLAVVQPQIIVGELYTNIAGRIPAAADLAAFSEDYEDLVADRLAASEAVLKDRPDQVKANLQADLDQEIDQGQTQLDQAKQALAMTQARVEQTAAALSQPQVALPGQDVSQVQAQLDQASQALTQAQAEVNQQESQLAEARREVAQISKPNYIINDRESVSGYYEYADNADRIAAIANVFPIFFFLIAVLVSFTTMTRMVDEQRTQIGTLKALGYRPAEIMTKYASYALLASLLGSMIGIGVGNYLFPYVIMYAYQTMFNFPSFVFNFYWLDVLLALVIAVITTVGPAIYTTWQTLRENTAQLLRPKPPKDGDHILLEKIPALWSRLGFQSKITLRNIFRYKGRNAMTVIGIAGCTALILTGLGISDSIAGLAQAQFYHFQTADATVSLQTDLGQDQYQELIDQVNQDERIQNYLAYANLRYQTDSQGDVLSQDVNVNVLADDQANTDFFNFVDPNNPDQTLTLDQSGAIVTEKLLDLLDLEVGDNLVLKNEQGEELIVPIAGASLSYVYHDVYLTSQLYEDLTGQTAANNRVLLAYQANLSTDQVDQLTSDLTALAGVAGVIDTDEMAAMFDQTIEMLDIITIVLILAAASLAFIVLYSLTNINVSERIRELSTIKVLGFYPLEVSMYIYRETLILASAGIFLGWGLGYLLCRYILSTVEVDFMRFPVAVNWQSYLLASLLSLAFSLIVMMIMHVKLKRVDMVEALKGVE